VESVIIILSPIYYKLRGWQNFANRSQLRQKLVVLEPGITNNKTVQVRVCTHIVILWATLHKTSIIS